ncbi:hypothetical protein Patl1_33060 [Pistacia atlantica]|uniref:Uncharacterized protein n=1 Tax=Pistacia atlantica TaxID=434234 RepID=A0ACC1ARW8_9ROSI|nr:hypothetical protein Patl1_33060 [Pistacia atlantica]
MITLFLILIKQIIYFSFLHLFNLFCYCQGLLLPIIICSLFVCRLDRWLAWTIFFVMCV